MEAARDRPTVVSGLHYRMVEFAFSVFRFAFNVHGFDTNFDGLAVSTTLRTQVLIEIPDARPTLSGHGHESDRVPGFCLCVRWAPSFD